MGQPFLFENLSADVLYCEAVSGGEGLGDTCEDVFHPGIEVIVAEKAVCNVIAGEHIAAFIIGVLVVVALGVIGFLACLPRISETVDFLKTLTDYAGEERVKTILRALGIAYLTSVAAELCRTCGEQSVVTYIETAGKITLLSLAVPLFKELIEIALIK